MPDESIPFRRVSTLNPIAPAILELLLHDVSCDILPFKVIGTASPD